MKSINNVIGYLQPFQFKKCLHTPINVFSHSYWKPGPIRTAICFNWFPATTESTLHIKSGTIISILCKLCHTSWVDAVQQ